MKYSNLGNTDIKVSKLCLGTMTFGEQNTEAEAHEQLDYALDNGINFIDTAEIYAVPCRKETYGKTEECIGSWIHARKNRDKYILASKVGGPSPYLASYIREDLGFSKRAILEAIEGSLKRLQTDYLDLYQLHWPERQSPRFGTRYYQHDLNWEDNFSDVIATLELLKKEGKIRYYGLSNETPWGTMRHLQSCDELGVNRPVSIQNAYNLSNRIYEYAMAEVSMRENIGLLAYSPLAMGMLTGKYSDGTATASSRLNKFSKSWPRYRGVNAMPAANAYHNLAQKHDLSTSQMALAFINSRPFVTSNIFGATNMKQLEENINSIHVELSEEILKSIEEVNELYPNATP